MILFPSLAKILVALALMSVIVPDMPAQAITRIGNSRTTTKVNNNKLAESRVGNGRTIDRKQPSRKILGHLVGNGVLKR
ncbi:hypothetical protein [Nostoc sp.]|uniref:hypothetical protein n=1 Tax=Nostoc sp. TaxID=1180 RepID=UPI002FFB38E8